MTEGLNWWEQVAGISLFLMIGIVMVSFSSDALAEYETFWGIWSLRTSSESRLYYRGFQLMWWAGWGVLGLGVLVALGTIAEWLGIATSEE